MMNSEQLSASALQLSRHPALKQVVQDIGARLTKEVMTVGTDPARSQEALHEYHALQRIVAGIDQMARNAIDKENAE